VAEAGIEEDEDAATSIKGLYSPLDQWIEVGVYLQQESLHGNGRRMCVIMRGSFTNPL